MELQWERIDRFNTSRLKVYGGWLVNYTQWTTNEDEQPVSQSSAMCFVPDPEHKWQ